MQAAFKPNWRFRIGALAVAAYVVYACSRFELTFERFLMGLSNGETFLGRLFPPVIAQPESLMKGLGESLEIAILATALGLLIAMPIGLLAARNLMPAGVSWVARGVIAASRSLHPVIVAIIFVKAVGFGAMAGILALTVASIGFVSKLFAEAIEEISLKQVEAIPPWWALWARAALAARCLLRFSALITILCAPLCCASLA
jgi:phosphonate transport system permease protein